MSFDPLGRIAAQAAQDDAVSWDGIDAEEDDESMTHGMDQAGEEMILWARDVMPDATPEAFARKFAEEAGELLGITIELPDDWSFDRVDVSEARDCALVLVALTASVCQRIGPDMLDKMRINRARPQHKQPDGTYHH